MKRTKIGPQLGYCGSVFEETLYTINSVSCIAQNTTPIQFGPYICNE